jgi:hypothetical protein
MTNSENTMSRLGFPPMSALGAKRTSQITAVRSADDQSGHSGPYSITSSAVAPLPPP